MLGINGQMRAGVVELFCLKLNVKASWLPAEISQRLKTKRTDSSLVVNGDACYQQWWSAIRLSNPEKDRCKELKRRTQANSCLEQSRTPRFLPTSSLGDVLQGAETQIFLIQLSETSFCVWTITRQNNHPSSNYAAAVAKQASVWRVDCISRNDGFSAPSLWCLWITNYSQSQKKWKKANHGPLCPPAIVKAVIR